MKKGKKIGGNYTPKKAIAYEGIEQLLNHKMDMETAFFTNFLNA